MIINKGVFIPKNNIIGTGAVVTKKFELTNTIIAGNPAKIIKEKINCCNERINCYEKNKKSFENK